MVKNGLPTRRSTSSLVVWGVSGVKSLACRIHFGRTPSGAAHAAARTAAAATPQSRADLLICVGISREGSPQAPGRSAAADRTRYAPVRVGRGVPRSPLHVEMDLGDVGSHADQVAVVPNLLFEPGEKHGEEGSADPAFDLFLGGLGRDRGEVARLQSPLRANAFLRSASAEHQRRSRGVKQNGSFHLHPPSVRSRRSRIGRSPLADRQTPPGPVAFHTARRRARCASAPRLRRPISARESQDTYNRPRESASVPSHLFVALASASRLALLTAPSGISATGNSALRMRKAGRTCGYPVHVSAAILRLFDRIDSVVSQRYANRFSCLWVSREIDDGGARLSS